MSREHEKLTRGKTGNFQTKVLLPPRIHNFDQEVKKIVLTIRNSMMFFI